MSADHPFTPRPDARSPERAEEITAPFSAKVMAEVAEADALAPGSDAVPARGNPLARVFVLKGLPGPAEASGGAAVSGADGEAVAKALAALGYPEDDAFFALTRPEPGATPERLISRLRALVEAVDPLVVIALDAEAASDVSEAIGVAFTSVAPGEAMGRRYVAVDGLEASLGDENRKRKMWRQLQAAAPPGPVY